MARQKVVLETHRRSPITDDLGAAATTDGVAKGNP
jgi:hypothetical protein